MDSPSASTGLVFKRGGHAVPDRGPAVGFACRTPAGIAAGLGLTQCTFALGLACVGGRPGRLVVLGVGDLFFLACRQKLMGICASALCVTPCVKLSVASRNCG